MLLWERSQREATESRGSSGVWKEATVIHIQNHSSDLERREGDSPLKREEVRKVQVVGHLKTGEEVFQESDLKDTIKSYRKQMVQR